MLKYTPLDSIGTYYQDYIRLNTETTIESVLSDSGKQLHALLEPLDDSMGIYRYQPNKWTINDLLQHLIDTERVFQFRALCFARADTNEMAGFEQDDYVLAAQANRRQLAALKVEFQTMRQSSIQLYQSFSEDMLAKTGVASGARMSVESIGYIISGHQLHHTNILKQRYL
jgi:uncharacterized damage-inducible protein DinB